MPLDWAMNPRTIHAGISLLVTMLVPKTFQYMSSNATLFANFKVGDLILNSWTPPKNRLHSFIVTCEFSKSSLGSKPLLFSCWITWKKVASKFFISTHGQFSKLGPSFSTFLCLISLSCMIEFYKHINII